MKNKIKDFFEKSLASQEVLKRIAFYLFVMCIFLILIFFKLQEINHNILLVSGNFSNSVLIETKDEKYKDVSDIFVSYPDEAEISDTVPLYEYENESSSSENTTAKSNEMETTSVKNESLTETTTSGNSSKISFVINVNSKKIHYADCSFVSRIKDENKKTIQLDKNELKEYLNNGYTICSTCGG